jgi:hypothetical protein
MKMIEKTRVGSRAKKKYDKPRTPYQEVLDSSHVEEGRKEALKKEHLKLNPAELKRQITKLQDKLRKIGLLREKNRITIKTMIKITKISSIFSVRQRIKLSNRFLYEAIVANII